MINFLAPLRPDEILISFVARQQYYSHSNLSDTYKSLFGVSQVTINTFLPNLSCLNTSILNSFNISRQEIENHHTLYPLYKSSLLNRKGASRHHSILAGKHEINYRNFKYCSECLEEDRIKFGEAYWHRVHNIPGIKLCSIHNLILNVWNVPLEKVSKRSLFCLEEVLREPLISKENNNDDLLEFTKRVEQALVEQNLHTKDQIIKKAINCGLLIKEKKKSVIDSARFSALIEKLFKDINTYPGTNLRRIRAALSSVNKFCDPLTLIAIGLLCDKIQLIPKIKLDAPKYPCNNKICFDFGTTNKITSKFYKLNHHKTEGIIQKCLSCGYSIIFNLRRDKQLYVVDYGFILLKNVLKLVKAGKSYSSISRQLKIDKKAVSKIFNTNTSVVKNLESDNNKILIEQRRNFWIEYLKSNEITNLSKLEGFAKTAYRFLQINDSLWLRSYNQKAGLKKIWQRRKAKSSFNDDEVVAALTKAKMTLLQTDIQRRVSKHLLLRQVSIQGLTVGKISDLENASNFLRTECESFFEWKKRRIKTFILLNKTSDLTSAQILDRFKTYRNSKSDQRLLKDFVNELLKT